MPLRDKIHRHTQTGILYIHTLNTQLLLSSQPYCSAPLSLSPIFPLLPSFNHGNRQTANSTLQTSFVSVISLSRNDPSYHSLTALHCIAGPSACETMLTNFGQLQASDLHNPELLRDTPEETQYPRHIDSQETRTIATHHLDHVILRRCAMACQCRWPAYLGPSDSSISLRFASQQFLPRLDNY